MRIAKCDKCNEEMMDRDVRYLKLYKEDAPGEAQNPITIPMMKELEICVLCAEELRKKIEAFQGVSV